MKTKNTATIKLITKIILWALFIIFIWQSFAVLIKTENSLESYSFRYDDIITEQQSNNLKELAIKNEDEKKFWPTFWREDFAVAQESSYSIPIQLISYSGQGSLLWNNPVLLNGNWEDAAEKTSCVISKGLAWQIFGSLDVVGLTLEIDEKAYLISGVLDIDENSFLAFVPYGETYHKDGWYNLEIPVNKGSLTYHHANQILAQSGIANTGGAQNSLAIKRLCRLAVISAPAVMLLYLIFSFAITFFAPKSKLHKFLFIFIILLVFSFCLPQILNNIPKELLPGKWSDFSFYSSLINTYKTQYIDFISIKSQTKDIDLHFKLLKLKFYVLISIVLCFACIRSINNKKATTQALYSHIQ